MYRDHWGTSWISGWTEYGHDLMMMMILTIWLGVLKVLKVLYTVINLRLILGPQSDGYDHQIMAMLDPSANSRGDHWVPLACDLHAFPDGLGMSTTLSSQGNSDLVHMKAWFGIWITIIQAALALVVVNVIMWARSSAWDQLLIKMDIISNHGWPWSEVSSGWSDVNYRRKVELLQPRCDGFSEIYWYHL